MLKAIGLGAAMAGLVWLVLIMLDSRRNPCERVRDHFCGREPAGTNCQMYKGIWQESVEDESPAAGAGIAAGDLVAAAAGQPVDGIDALHRALDAAAPNGTVTLTVVRGTEERQVEVDLAGSSA